MSLETVAAAGAERRAEPRTTLNTQIPLPTLGTGNAYLDNISTTGVFIRTTDLQPVGSRIKLQFTVILDDMQTIDAEGEVVRVVPDGGPHPAGMGVRFTKLTPLSLHAVHKLTIGREPMVR